MAIGASTVWRCRIGGDNLNGGAFDPTIVGAGTDYTEQDAAQLTLTNLTTSGASAIINSVSGGFTAAMIGNAIYIASGTSFTAGTYFITAVGSTNSATLDRNCSTGSGSNGVGRVGGAHADPVRQLAAGMVAGNTVLVRGQGSNEPSDTDYFLSTTGFVPPPGCSYIGYNGRPKVGHVGRVFAAPYNLALKNFSFVQTAATYLAQGVISGGSANFAENCVFDQAGFDSVQLASTSINFCTFLNTGSQVPGSHFAFVSTSGSISCVARNSHFKDLRGGGLTVDARSPILGCIVQNCGGVGINVTAATLGANYNLGMSVMGCTVHGNVGHGIQINNPLTLCADNLITGHVGAGTYGLFYSSDPGSFGRNYSRVARNNFHGNTANSNYALSTLDTTIDPQYLNAPTVLTPQNTALRYLAGIGSL